MAEVRAFPGVRYAEQIGDLASVVCAPYDVITPEAQAAAYARSPYNAIRLELGETRPTDGAADNRYTRAARTLHQWLADGVLARDPAPCLYAYEEAFPGIAPGRRRGFFARVRLAEWSERVVLPHERTLPKPRADRLSLLRATRTNLSPVFSLYEDPNRRIAAALDVATSDPPTAAFSLPPGLVAAAAPEHRLWKVDTPAVVREVEAALADRQLYIADGHHRYETALENWRAARTAGAGPDDPAAYLLMHLVDLADPGLVVLPLHRLVRVESLDRAAALAGLRHHFDVEEAPLDASALLPRLAALGQTAHAYAVLGVVPGRALVISAPHAPALDSLLPADRSAAWRGLDVAVLHRVVLERILGLDAESAAAERIGYTRDAAEALDSVERGDYPLAVLLNATRVEQIRDVALAGDRMPEKSTYFWPKPPTGLAFYTHFD